MRHTRFRLQSDFDQVDSPVGESGWEKGIIVFYENRVPRRVIYGGLGISASATMLLMGIPELTVMSSDTPVGILLLVGISGLGCIVSLLFLLGVRWTRWALSAVLHLALFALIYGFIFSLLNLNWQGDNFVVGGLFALGAANCVLGIILLHGRSLSEEFESRNKGSSTEDYAEHASE